MASQCLFVLKCSCQELFRVESRDRIYSFSLATNSFPLRGPFVQTTKSCAPVSGKFYCTMDKKHQKQATEKISMFLPSTQSIIIHHCTTIGDSSSQELWGRAQGTLKDLPLSMTHLQMRNHLQANQFELSNENSSQRLLGQSRPSSQQCVFPVQADVTQLH